MLATRVFSFTALALFSCGSTPPAPTHAAASVPEPAAAPTPAPAITPALGPLTEKERVSILATPVKELIPTESTRLRYRWSDLPLEDFLREVSEPSANGLTVVRAPCRDKSNACVEVKADPCADSDECEGFPLAIIVRLTDGRVTLDHIDGPMAEPINNLEDVDRQREMAP